jgi:hypothetical protein
MINQNLLYFHIVLLQISKELIISGISQSAMSRLKKRHHRNVNVWKWGSIFAKCIICDNESGKE